MGAAAIKGKERAYYLALYAKINEFGFIETPYRVVEKVKKGSKTLAKVTDNVVYLTADDEEEFHITHCGINIDKDGVITDPRVALRFKGSFLEGENSLVDYIDLTPRRVVGVSASLIPFLAHDEGNRALMGSNMQCQSVPLITSSSPVVGTGMEGAVAKAMGRVVLSDADGIVDYVDADKVEIKLDKKTDLESGDRFEVAEGGKRLIYKVNKFVRTASPPATTRKSSRLFLA